MKKAFKKISLALLLAITTLVAVFAFVPNLKARAAAYSNVQGNFAVMPDGSVKATFDVADNDLDMKGWLLCLFSEKPALNDDNSLVFRPAPHGDDRVAHYFFVPNTAQTGTITVTWPASANDQKTNWSADGTTASTQTLAGYMKDDTNWHIVIGPRHYNTWWDHNEVIGEGLDGYWENSDLYIGSEEELNVLSSFEGNGSGDTPYLIDSKVKLEAFRDMVNGGETGICAKLTADIYLNGSDDDQWIPIAAGTEVTDAYRGTFDGNGHTIYGLYMNITESSDYCKGLFGTVRSGTIKDLTVQGNITTNSRMVGGIAGNLLGNAGTTLVERCHSMIKIGVPATPTQGYWLGGIAGQVNEQSGEVIIRNCLFSGEIIGASTIGGIVGRMTNGLIDSCLSLGNVAKTSSGQYTYENAVGSLVGESTVAEYNITNCYKISSRAYIGKVKDSESEVTAAVEGKFGTVSENIINSESDSNYVYRDFDFVNQWMFFNSFPIPKINYTFEGEGTLEKPYLIKTVRDFSFMSLYKKGNFALVNDLDFTNHPWTPIFGSKDGSPFDGTLDGRGHTLNNLNIKPLYENKKQYMALFASTYVNSFITNLTINGSVTGSNYVGALVGYSKGYIYNVTNNANVTGSGSYVGGLVGHAYTGFIEFSTNNGNVNNTSTYTGGIAGSSDGRIRCCTNNGNITSTYAYSSAGTGGIIGESTSSGSIQNSINNGVITGAGGATGGIVGLYKKSVNYCINTGNVVNQKTATSNYLGAIAGKTDGSGTTAYCSYCYFLKGTDNGGNVINNGESYSRTGSVTAEQMINQSYMSNLGYNFNIYWDMGSDHPVVKTIDESVNDFMNNEGFAAEDFDLINQWTTVKNYLTNSSNYVESAKYFLRDLEVGKDDELGETEYAKMFIKKYDDAFRSMQKLENDDYLKRIVKGTLVPLPENVKAVYDLIDAIGTVEHTAECKAKIDAAQEAFDALSEEDQALVSNKQVLVTAQSTYEDLGVVEEFTALVNIFGTVEITEACAVKMQELIVAERNLTFNQKNLVPSSVKEQAQSIKDEYYVLLVEDKIDKLPPVSASEECRDKVNEISDALQELSSTAFAQLDPEKLNSFFEYAADYVEAVIADIQPVDASKNTEDKIINAKALLNQCPPIVYGKISEEAIKALSDKEVEYVEALIDDIGTVTLTEESDAKIAKAFVQYGYLLDEQKAEVSNFNVLSAAIDRYIDLQTAKDFEDAVAELGDAEYTTEFREKLDDLGYEYDSMTKQQKELISQSTLDLLLHKEDEYQALRVEALIDAIAEAATDAEKIAAIEEALEQYDYLSDAQTALVKPEKYEALMNSIPTLAGLLIDAIGTVDASEESQEKVEAARYYFDALTDEQLAEFDEEKINTLLEKEVDLVEALIDSIGVIDASAECKELVMNVQEKFLALSEDQQAEVDEVKKEKLFGKETELVNALIDNLPVMDATDASGDMIDDLYEMIGNLSDEQLEDVTDERLNKLSEKEVEYVVALIDALPAMDTSEEAKEQLDNVISRYESLSNNQKSTVPAPKLEALNNAKAEYVEALIDSLGEPEYTEEYSDELDAVWEEFENLTAEQQAKVEEDGKLAVLEAKENKYYALGVEELIDAIGEISATPQSKAKIKNARDAYKGLLADAKELVDPAKLAILEAAEAQYVELLIDLIPTPVKHDEASSKAIAKAYSEYQELNASVKEQVDEDKKAILFNADKTYQALGVEEIINALFPVEGTNAMKIKIGNAENALNRLPEDVKALVSEEAKAKLIEAKSSYVEARIENIGDVEYTKESKEKIDAARQAYEELETALKPNVSNLAKLTEAENTYTVAGEIVELIETIGSVSYPESEAKINEVKAKYDELTDSQKKAVINVERLTQAQAEFNTLKKKHNSSVGLGVGLGVAGGLILVCGTLFVLAFFVFNKWSLDKDKVVRTFVFSKKSTDAKVMTITFKFKKVSAQELFNTKEEAEASKQA